VTTCTTNIRSTRPCAEESRIKISLERDTFFISHEPRLSGRESAMRAMRLTAFLALFLSLLVASATCQEVEDLAPELEACRAQVRTSDVYRQD